ncbi:nonstructural protein [Microviridae sp.]|nr:nonstructural protein [Microviridae sp.]
MMMKLFAVKDVKTEAYANPWCVRTEAVAIRGFAQACEDKETDWHKFPDDFSLYELGDYNPESGIINGHADPKRLCSASEFVK